MPSRLPGSSSLMTAAIELPILPRKTALTTTAAAVRTFTSTPKQQRTTRNRQNMLQWFQTQADRNLKDAPGQPVYVSRTSNQPFPLNPLFRSEEVLSDELKEVIHDRVVVQGEAMKAVSQEFGVDVRRVAAVVRLKAVEKNMVAAEQPLAWPYSEAMSKMLPQRGPEGHHNGTNPFEPVNEIPMHAYTMPQLFVPTSESRQFTREDAAKAFHEHLLSADDRSYQKELIAAEREIVNGEEPETALKNYKKEVQRVEEEHAERVAARQQAVLDRTSTVDKGRATFRIKDIKAEDAGRDGKSRRGVGWRYGAPHQDRKRGLIKIPTSVP